MKYVMNAGVRETIETLDRVSRKFDELTRALSNPAASYDAACDAGLEREAVRNHMVSLACRILSHATRGERYPEMTTGYKSEKS